MSSKLRRRAALLLAISMLVSIVVFPGDRTEAAQAAEEKGGNLFANGSFEDKDESGNAANWTTIRYTGSVQASVSDSVYKEGSHAYQLTGTNVTDRASIRQIVQMENEGAGKTFKLQFWVKSDSLLDNGKAYVRYQFLNPEGQKIGAVNYSDMTYGTTDWTFMEKAINIPDGTAAINFEAFLDTTTGTVWFDDFSISEHVPLTDFSLNPPILEIGIGEKTKAEAAFSPENATNRELVWSSSNTVVASVYRDGRVYGHAPGYSVISAMSPETKQTRSAVVSVGMDPPVSLSVQPYSGTVTENGVLTGMLPASDAANAPIAFAKATEPKYGKVTVEPEGTFKYYPDRNFSGTDEFVFMARTTEEGPAFAVASIRVEPLEKPPVLDMLWYWTDKDEPLSGMLGNVAAPAGEAVTWSESGAETRGDLTVLPDGSFTYTPAPGFTGFDTLEVTATASGGLTSTGKAKVFVVPEQADFIKQLADNGFAAQHPRLLATAEDFEYTRSLIGQDRYVSEWFDKLKQETDSLLEQEPYRYLGNGGNNGNIRDLLLRASLMYRLTGEEKYAQRGIEELESAAQFPDWGGRHNNMLSLTYVTLGSASPTTGCTRR
ncbi:hypothetical protein HMSSN036_50030 [Paenibacillus macerans]|nr:hypothetical protein HMSSN036_50030 [Paenibacillus macerans]